MTLTCNHFLVHVTCHVGCTLSIKSTCKLWCEGQVSNHSPPPTFSSSYLQVWRGYKLNYLNPTLWRFTFSISPSPQGQCTCSSKHDVYSIHFLKLSKLPFPEMDYSHLEVRTCKIPSRGLQILEPFHTRTASASKWLLGKEDITFTNIQLMFK